MTIVAHPIDETYFRRKKGAAHWTRLDIATALSGPPRTKAECARALGREYPSISDAFDEMVRDRVIEELPGDAGPSTRYVLVRGMYEIVEHARAGEEAVGYLLPAQVLVEVTADDQETLRNALGHRQLMAAVAWVARVADDPPRALLVLSARAAPSARERLLAALPHAGVRCHAIPIQEAVSAAQYRREGESVLTAVEDIRRAARR